MSNGQAIGITVRDGLVAPTDIGDARRQLLGPHFWLDKHREPPPPEPPLTERQRLSVQILVEEIARLNGLIQPPVVATSPPKKPPVSAVPQAALPSGSSARILYGKREAARQLSMSERQLDYYIAAKVIHIRKNGTLVHVPHSELVRFSRSDHPGVIRAARKKAASEAPSEPVA